MFSTSGSNGITQNERLLRALLPQHVQLDERKLRDRLAFAASFAELLKYYTVEKGFEGNWQPFFLQDEAVFLSTVLATDLRSLENKHDNACIALEHSPLIEDKKDHLRTIYEQIIDQVYLLDEWYRHAIDMNKTQLNVVESIEYELQNAIEQRLAQELQALLDLQDRWGITVAQKYESDELFYELHPKWFPNGQRVQARGIEAEDTNAEKQVGHYLKQLRIFHRSFFNVLSYVVLSAAPFLERSLSENDNHKPDVGLFIVFLRLLEHSQAQLNTFTEQHLDFYYYQVLRFKERGYAPDYVNLHLRIAEQDDAYVLPAQTRFLAGVDENGEDILFETQEEVLLNRAEIASLKTIYVGRNPLIGIGSSYQLISKVYAAPEANSRDGLGERFIGNEKLWPPFGEEQFDRPKNDRRMIAADLGWAIASPMLELEEGKRSINIRLHFERESMATLQLLIRDISQNEKLSREDAFSKIFLNSLKMELSSSEGWYEVDTGGLLPPNDWQRPELRLQLNLSAAAPPIIAYGEAELGEEFHPEYPVLRILHRRQDAIYPYSFLKELKLESIHLEVDVQEAKKFVLFNEFGQVDPRMPFQPFGPTPRQGAYFLLGKAELFKKELSDLAFQIEWHNLPKERRGFQDYYNVYPERIRNSSFKVGFSALNANTFHPAEGEAPLKYSLFKTDLFSSGVRKKTRIDGIPIERLSWEAKPNSSLPPVYDNTTSNGFFRFELLEPEMGFGTDVYQDLFTRIVTENASPRNRKKPPQELPKQPYIPVIREMTVDYKAVSQINIVAVETVARADEEARLYHIHPFGIHCIHSEEGTESRYLLPRYDEDGYLFMGLENLEPPTQLALLFELRYPRNVEVKDDDPDFQWSYWTGEDWQYFSREQLLSDTTAGFTQSGIIQLVLPRDMERGTNILDKELHWLRISVRGKVEGLAHCALLTTQAVQAVWVHNGSTERLAKPLPAGSIERLASPVPVIREVEQPFPSFGGIPGESKLGFYIRSSERLRHKYRAVSVWDYERLILSEFPDIYQVKCVQHQQHEDFVEKGQLILVLLPKFEPKNSYVEPLVNQSRLAEVQEFVARIASPFGSVLVRNPLYERLKISCGVYFQKGKNNGNFLKKLNQDIMRFISPWMFEQSHPIELGGSLNKDVVLSFVEKMDYVQFVTKFSMVQVYTDARGYDLEDTARDQSNSPLVRATTPWSILVPLEEQPISFLEAESFQEPEKAGIETMIVGTDFIITEEKGEERRRPANRGAGEEQQQERFFIRIDV